MTPSALQSPLARLRAVSDLLTPDAAPVGDRLTVGDVRAVLKAIEGLETALRKRSAEIEAQLHRRAFQHREQGDELGAARAELELMTRAARIRGAYIGVLKRAGEAAQAALLDRSASPIRKMARALDALEKISRTKKDSQAPGQNAHPPTPAVPGSGAIHEEGKS